MIKQKGLGRGLDALLGGNKENTFVNNEGELRVLAIGDLKPGKYQPRTKMDKAGLEELALSIKQRGIVQPILTREIGGGKFEIVAGERPRLRVSPRYPRWCVKLRTKRHSALV